MVYIKEQLQDPDTEKALLEQATQVLLGLDKVTLPSESFPTPVKLAIPSQWLVQLAVFRRLVVQICQLLPDDVQTDCLQTIAEYGKHSL